VEERKKKRVFPRGGRAPAMGGDPSLRKKGRRPPPRREDVSEVTTAGGLTRREKFTSYQKKVTFKKDPQGKKKCARGRKDPREEKKGKGLSQYIRWGVFLKKRKERAGYVRIMIEEGKGGKEPFPCKE